MATYRQIQYMIYDELKLSSDDSFFTPEHILFLMDNYRALLIKQRYENIKKEIPLLDYQIICLDLEYKNDCLYGESLKSVQEVPYLMNLNGYESMSLNPVGDLFNNYEYTMVSNNRFPFTGINKFLKRIVYFTLGKDRHLYVKGANPDYKYLKKIQIKGVFENPQEAEKLSCDDNCPTLDREYPLEVALIAPLIQMIVNELRQPSTVVSDDKTNDAKDNMPEENKPSYMPGYAGPYGGYNRKQ